MKLMKNLKLNFYTILPEVFPGFLGTSLTGKALKDGKWSYDVINIRDYATDVHKSVDDTPLGGGAGMVMKPDILAKAIRANHSKGRLIYLSPRGKVLSQQLAKELAKEEEISFICGRFEGVDQRVLDAFDVEELSIGDYVLTGGDQAALIVCDAVIRLLPSVLGNADSIAHESFENYLLEHNQYTRPQSWEGMDVPEVLLSGHHKNINDFRHQQSLKITKEKRADLYQKYLDSMEKTDYKSKK